MGHEKIDSDDDQEDVWEMEKQDESTDAFDICHEFDDEENLYTFFILLKILLVEKGIIPFIFSFYLELNRQNLQIQFSKLFQKKKKRLRKNLSHVIFSIRKFAEFISRISRIFRLAKVSPIKVHTRTMVMHD